MNLVWQSGYKEHAAQHILYYHKRQPVHVGQRPQSDCFHYWPTEPFLHTTATDRHMYNYVDKILKEHQPDSYMWD